MSEVEVKLEDQLIPELKPNEETKEVELNEEEDECGEETNGKDEEANSYLNRGEYSSENYKIEIKNLPKYFGFGVNVKNLFVSFCAEKLKLLI